MRIGAGVVMASLVGLGCCASAIAKPATLELETAVGLRPEERVIFALYSDNAREPGHATEVVVETSPKKRWSGTITCLGAQSAPYSGIEGLLYNDDEKVIYFENVFEYATPTCSDSNKTLTDPEVLLDYGRLTLAVTAKGKVTLTAPGGVGFNLEFPNEGFEGDCHYNAEKLQGSSTLERFGSGPERLEQMVIRFKKAKLKLVNTEVANCPKTMSFTATYGLDLAEEYFVFARLG